nr:hypothetical protein [Angustibacter aerolatus]
MAAGGGAGGRRARPGAGRRAGGLRRLRHLVVRRPGRGDPARGARARRVRRVRGVRGADGPRLRPGRRDHPLGHHDGGRALPG